MVFYAQFAKKDALSLFSKGEVNCVKVINFIAFKEDDLVKMVGISSNSTCCDAPDALKCQLEKWAILLNLVAEYFEGDMEKTALWFKTSNPVLGDISPWDMIRFGRCQKLLHFVLDAVSENQH
jgi:hypothetical protein